MTEENRPDQESPEPSFEKVDKRHSAEEKAAESAPEELEEEITASPEEEAVEETAEEPEEETATEEAAEPAEEAAPEAVSLTDLSVSDTLRFMLGLLVQQAWIHLGIRVAPGANELVADLPQARLAIDTVDSLVEKLQSELSASERSELSSELANLRLNYVKKAE